VSWQAASLALLGLVLAGGFAWYERDKPPARVLALVATLAALAVAGRLVFAAVPNVKPTTDIVLFAGYALGPVPGFAVGAITAVVSNVFLSQGPWTPWQMVGWGAVGLAGAMLARAWGSREPGRAALAALCGAAGLAFGAWMDVYQWTLGAHQSVDAYLAVSASSLPYNLAHAIGNVVFCLLIGPAFVRALRRYRRRLEVRWEKAPAGAGVAAAALAALVVAGGLVGGPRAAEAATAAAQPAAGAERPATGAARPAAGAAQPAASHVSARAVRYLLRAQNTDGGFGSAPGQRSGALYTGWSGLGLAAAGRNPRDVHRRGGRSIASYVLRGGPPADIGEIERTVLLLKAAGLSPRSFAGKDLVAAIRSRRRRDGSIAGYVSYTAFGVLALCAAGESAGRPTINWLARSQNADGGFGVAPSSASDSDMTGATVQALAAVNRARGATAQRAVAWLRANQNDDGGFGQFKGRPSNAQSTSYAVQGLVAVGAADGVASRALRYLTDLQRSDGSIAYSRASTQTPVWVTAQALMAIERVPLPLAAVPRDARRPRAGRVESPGAAPTRKPPATSGKANDGERQRPAPAVTTEEEAPVPTANDPVQTTATSPGLSRTRPKDERDDGPGRSAAMVAAAVAGTLVLLWLLRRRLRPRRLRRGPAT
jgi:energy-coupling factor transport system substrate-specific component